MLQKNNVLGASRSNANHLFRLFSLTACVALAACAHAPTPSDIALGASFTANILADGTKLFTYSERRLGRDEDMIDERRERGMAGQGDERVRPPMSRSRSAQSLQRNLAAMLAQNHYCRDNYMVLEQYEERTGYVIRGECRDPATDSDRQLFPQSKK